MNAKHRHFSIKIVTGYSFLCRIVFLLHLFLMIFMFLFVYFDFFKPIWFLFFFHLIAEFPWVVAIIHKVHDNDVIVNVYKCGGTLIHPSVIMTAAHW